MLYVSVSASAIPLDLYDACADYSNGHESATQNVADVVFGEIEAGSAGVEGFAVEIAISDEVLELETSCGDVWA